jgi:hypothetical protein
LAGGLRPELAPPLAVVAALLAEERRAAAAAAAPSADAVPELRVGPSAWVLAARHESVGA